MTPMETFRNVLSDKVAYYSKDYRYYFDDWTDDDRTEVAGYFVLTLPLHEQEELLVECESHYAKIVASILIRDNKERRDDLFALIGKEWADAVESRVQIHLNEMRVWDEK